MRSTATSSKDKSDRREKLLVDRVARGDEEAFDALFRRYHPLLFRFAFRLTSSYGMAEEVANDVLLTVWKNADAFRGDSRVSTWIFGIAYRCSLKSLRRRRRPWVSLRDEDLVEARESERAEREQWVGRALDALPAKQKLTVLLVYYAGLTCEETAVATGIPAATVRTRMFHARKNMQSLLEDSAVPARERKQK